MEKEKILKNMMAWYYKKSFTHNYCFGYKFNGVIYAALVNNIKLNTLLALSKLDKASTKNGGGYSVKYQMNAKLWEMIIAIADDVKIICTENAFNRLLTENPKKNRGVMFEELASATFGGELDPVPNKSFMDGGDFYINGVAYQAKYLKATFTTEATMLKNLVRG